MPSFSVDTGGTLTNGLIGAFKLQGDASNAIGSNHGTLNGGASYSTAYGKSGQGIAFNGTTGYISLPSLFAPGSAFTISAWVYCASAVHDTSMRVYRFGPRTGCSPSSTNFGMGYSNTAGFFMYCSAGCENQPISQNLSYTAGTWANVLITINGTGAAKMVRYFNGTAVGTYNYGSAVSLGNGDHEIGGDWAGGSHYVASGNWYIDEIYVWNRILTGTEIADVTAGSFYTLGPTTYSLSFTATVSAIPTTTKRFFRAFTIAATANPSYSRVAVFQKIFTATATAAGAMVKTATHYLSFTAEATATPSISLLTRLLDRLKPKNVLRSARNLDPSVRAKSVEPRGSSRHDQPHT